MYFLQRFRTSYSYNDNGNLTGGPFSAAFDVLNRITQVIVGGTTNDYILDPLNRQARKTSNSTETNFLYDGQQMIEEYDDGDALVNRYIRGNRADEIFIKIAGSTKTYLHHDRLGSVIAQTDDTGAVLNRYKYGPFGETPSLTGTPFGYTGQRYDSEVGLYNYKARIYSPAIGRFLQPDPIGYDAGDMNLYAYVNNDAVNMLDSEGLQAYGIPGCRGGGGGGGGGEGPLAFLAGSGRAINPNRLPGAVVLKPSDDVSKIYQTFWQLEQQASQNGIRQRGILHNVLQSWMEIQGNDQACSSCALQGTGMRVAMGNALQGKLQGDWIIIEKEIGIAQGASIHTFNLAIPKNPNDPIIFLDPWAGAAFPASSWMLLLPGGEVPRRQ